MMAASRPERAPSSALADALARWQDAAGPFWPYVCATPFLSELPVIAPTVIRPRIPAALAHALPGPGEPGTAIFVDLPPEATLPATALLRQRDCIVVPVIQRWAVAPAVIRSARLLGLLVALAREARAPTVPRAVVFLIDGRRLGTNEPWPGPPSRVRRTPLGRRFDNRYQYPICRFPPPSLLLAHGFQRAVWVPEQMAPDLQPYASRLAAAGIAIPEIPAPRLSLG
jgi:hypothetical protein